MAYLRGDYSLWADGDGRLHIWAADGADGWQESGWAMNAEGTRRPHAGGVAIPTGVLDEYVMMRFAELLESGEAAQALDRALRHGSFGGDALRARSEAIGGAIERLQASTE